MVSWVGLVVLVATSLAFDTTFFSILSVDSALAGLSLMLPAPDLAVGEFSFFVTELLVFIVLLHVASSAAGLDSDTDLAVAVCLAKDFTTGLGLAVATLGTAFDTVLVGVSVFRCALAESFRVVSTAFSAMAV